MSLNIKSDYTYVSTDIKTTRSPRSTKKEYFEHFEVTPKNVETAVLLLASSEPEVIWPSLRALSKFAEKNLTNCQMIFELDATTHIARHIDSRDIVVKRYALMLLSFVAKVPGATELFLSNPNNIKTVASVMMKVEDVHALEFATLCMSILTKSYEGCEQFLIINIWNTLFSRMKKSEDPDIQNNCLHILLNVLQSPECAAEVVKNPQFSWSSILCQLQNKYCNIQKTTLNVIKNIVTRFDDIAAQNSFRQSTGIVDMLDVLDMYQFRDIHNQTLDVIYAYAETRENITHLHKNLGIKRLLLYLDMALPLMKPHALAVLAKLSFDRSGREALYELEGDLEFCKQLTGSNLQCLAEAATGVANMTKWLPSAIRMSDTNVVKSLCAILEDDTMEWYHVRMNSLKALTDLCRRIPKAACSLIEPKTFAAIKYIYSVNHDDVPIEAQRLAMQCCLNLQIFTDSLNALINVDFIYEVLNVLLKRFDIKLKTLTCEVLRGLMTDEIYKDYFMTCNGPKAIHDNLKIEHIGLRTALCDLLAASVMDDSADVYLELGTVHYMIENKLARYKVKSWEAALDQIFQHHPSAKFAYTGRLEINDIIRDDFYVMKKLQSPFPSISQIKSMSPPYKHPVYICRFRHPASRRNSSMDIRTPYQLIKVPQESNPGTTGDEESDPSPTPLSDTYDDNLRKYLNDLMLVFGDRRISKHYLELEEYKYLIRSRDKCKEVSTSLKQKAQFLAEFIADRMNCETQMDCGVSGMDHHLLLMMRARNTPIISIGDVKCGGSLERSVLYKALADRFGLPCSMHRIRGGHTWCEIAVPEPAPDEPVEGSVYPQGLLRPSYVVDLTFQPGRLLPKDTFEANRYCGLTKPYYTVSTLYENTNENKENLHCNENCKKNRCWYC